MKTLRANVIRLAHQNPSMRKALLDIITACDCESEATIMGKFEEGVPADPTENMSEEDAKEWKIQNLRNRDNFTAAQRGNRFRASKRDGSSVS